MIEFLCIVVGLVTGFIIGALVYRNNAEQWKEKSEVIEAQFDAKVAELTKELASKKTTRKKK